MKGQPRTPGSGRVKGTPNKSTRDVREAIAVFAQGNVGKMNAWLRDIANGKQVSSTQNGKRVKRWLREPDPGKALDLYLRALEYHIPKLARTELANGADNKFVVEIVQFAPPQKPNAPESASG